MELGEDDRLDLGELDVFFFPTKNISTGEGGMITCSDKSLFSKFKLMAAHGISTQSIEREKKSLPWHKIAKLAGHNYRMSNLLAGLGLEQLKKIKKLNLIEENQPNYILN